MAPKVVYIIPYRDRETHKDFFLRHMKYVLEDVPEEDYEIYFVHQRDKQQFNRGAMRNIGFLAMKEKYRNDYLKMTFVFNDVDCMPFNKGQLQYETTQGNVKHFYGFYFALGGVVSITGKDFETVNGYPNFWAWGWEDNELQRRVSQSNLHIDRSNFYEILSKEFIHMHHGTFREVNHLEKKRYNHRTQEGIKDITLKKYTIENHMIQVDEFSTGTAPNPNQNSIKLLGSSEPKKQTMKMALTLK